MKMTSPILYAAVFFLLAGFNGIAGAAETLKQREQREASMKQLEIRLSEVSAKLGGLGSRSSNVKDESKKEYIQLTDDLQKKQETANRKMAQLRAAGGQDWERLKAETNSAIDDLNRVYERMSTLFKSI